MNGENSGNTGKDSKNSISFVKEKSFESNEKLMDLNSSYHLHISQCSSLSSESDLSLSTLSIDRELNMYTSKIIDADELPAFEIRLISPMGRTPSPIDSDMDFDTPTKCSTTPKRTSDRHTPNYRQNNPDFVTLHDINAQISPPSDNDESISRSDSLETIFEGVFLHTPPRQRRPKSSHSSLLEKVALNRLHYDKENFTPPPYCQSKAQLNIITKQPINWSPKEDFSKLD